MVIDNSVCDPDCIGLSFDENTESCMEDELHKVTCEEYQGEMCDPRQMCTGEELFFETIGEICCINGSCYCLP